MVDIRHLEVLDCPIDELSMPSVKKLILQNVSSIRADFFEVHKEIETLELKTCRAVDDETLYKIVRNLKNLSSIAIENCKISNESLKAIKRFGERIEKISIKGSVNELNWKILECQRKLKIVIET